MMSDEDCFLKNCINCSGSGSGGLVSANRLRVASLSRQDNLHETLSDEANLNYWCHKSCVSTYTSKWHISKHTKNKCEETELPPPKRPRRSEDYSFVFKENCFLCGVSCQELDIRHPDRWRSFSYVRTADRGTQKSFKDVILETCTIRDDEWGNEVRVRVQGAVSDLHAADAQYHHDCLRKFKLVNRSESQSCMSVDDAFEHVCVKIVNDKTRIWNAVELDELYKSCGGLMSRQSLTEKISNRFGSDLLILSGVGVANIFVFRAQASKHMKLTANDEDDIDTAVERVARKIFKESQNLKREQSTYNTRICLDDVLSCSSPTLLNLLSRISPKLEKNLPAAMVGNMVTGAVTNKPTFLQIALGVAIREKIYIEMLHNFFVTSTYDEVLRFKCSAAQAATKSKKNLGITENRAGQIQVVADNFDANISSPNGLKTTHALAMLITQPTNVEDHRSDSETMRVETIRRVSKAEMADDLIQDELVEEYLGPKKPSMPISAAMQSPLSLKILARQVISLNRAQDTDFQFLKEVVSPQNVPEYGGYNTAISRKQGHAVEGATKAIYLPLIDMLPTDPSTMLTAMMRAQKLTNEAGQTHTIFTNDQQLYRIAVDISWVYQETFSRFVPRLGGMHTVMSFVGAICTLMADSGLEEIMKAGFGGVGKMMKDKNYPQNTRALRIVVEELLRNFDADEKFASYSELMEELETQANQSRTTRLWLDNLIKPVLIIMLHVRAEREGDWPLHLYSTQLMIPYFFAAGHFNYARYCLYYVNAMSKLPKLVEEDFLNGNHVMRHVPGIFNGVSSDLYIESTFMRFGHSPGGIIGITLQPSTLKRWALGLHICSQLKKDVMGLSTSQKHTKAVTVHKEEGPSRIKTDNEDRQKIREKLAMCIDPLEPGTHPTGTMINIVTGKLSDASANVDDAVNLVGDLMRSFRNGWPESFNKKLTKPTISMAISREKVDVGGEAVYDTTLIFSRLSCLQTVRKIEMKEVVMNHELAGVPTSLFDDNGDMQIPSSKSQLKSKLQVEISDRNIPPPDANVVDACAILWVVRWPDHGVVEDYIKNFLGNICSLMLSAPDTYLDFDRYRKHSIKESTRASRAGKHASRQHDFMLHTPLPPQKVCLAVTYNKVQLIKLIEAYAKEHCDMFPKDRKLVITGQEDTPFEIYGGEVRPRPDLRTKHEEADVIIVQHCVQLAKSGKRNIRIIADDTDIFDMLMHNYLKCQLTCNIFMCGTSAGRTSADIRASAKKHADIVDALLPAHVISGCDTVSSMYGIGKGKVITTLKTGNHSLSKLGSLEEGDLRQASQQCVAFAAACYGFPHETNMSALRYKVWTKKMGNHNRTKAPELRSLPPTTEAFHQHVLRAHLQAAIWRNALCEPPDLNPEDFGWVMDSNGKLEPVPLPANVPLVPESVKKIIKCGCSSLEPCSTARCSCTSAGISCSTFCACQASDSCRNPQTVNSTQDDDFEDEPINPSNSAEEFA